MESEELRDFCGFPRKEKCLFSFPMHGKGALLKDKYLQAERRLIRYAGLEPFHKIRFAKSRYEALVELFLSYASQIAKVSGKNYILAFKTPLLEELALKFVDVGLRFDWIESATPIFTFDLLKEKIRPRTGLVLLPWVCPYTGVIQPILEIIPFLKEEGVMVLLDATYAMGNLFFELKELRADGYLFEMEGGVISATLPISLWEKTLKSYIDSDEILHLEKISLALEKKWLELEVRSFERAHLRSYFEEKVEELEWRVHFRDFDRIGDFTCIEGPIHPEHMQFLLQKEDVFVFQSEAVRQKLTQLLQNELAAPLILKWPEEGFTMELVEKVLKVIYEIHKKTLQSVKQKDICHVIQ